MAMLTKEGGELRAGPGQAWQCLCGEQVEDAHDLLSHIGSRSREGKGKHKPVGLVDTATNELIQPWSGAIFRGPKEAGAPGSNGTTPPSRKKRTPTGSPLSISVKPEVIPVDPTLWLWYEVDKAVFAARGMDLVDNFADWLKKIVLRFHAEHKEALGLGELLKVEVEEVIDPVGANPVGAREA